MVVVGLFCTLAATACSRASATGRTSVLMVVIDTLRADELGCYGDAAGLTPNLDALAAEGVLFESASSHAPWTLPSMASLLTSLHPEQHGAGGVVPNFRALGKGVDTLPAVFQRAGYETASIVNVAFLGETFGLTKGFAETDEEHYQNNRQVRSAEKTTDRALAWIESRADADKPFFLFVHYFDPHAVYDPPQPFRRRFALPRDREDESWVFGTRQHMIALRQGKLELKPAAIRRAKHLYGGEIAYTDSEVGRLLAGLERLGLKDSTLVTFTSDHGEEFLDHGGFEHGHSLHAELTHVPLILRLPGALEPRRVPQSVGHIDVAPTLCELADLASSEQFVGRSLLGLMDDESAQSRVVLAHGNFWAAPLTSWREGPYKLILDPGAGSAELYRWREDPGEEHDLAGAEPQVVERLKANLELYRKQMAFEVQGHEERGPGSAVRLSAEERARLESFGYVGDAEPREPEKSPPKRPPKSPEKHEEH